MHVDTMNQMDSLKNDLTNNDALEKALDALKAPSNDILNQNNMSAQSKPLSMFGASQQ